MKCGAFSVHTVKHCYATALYTTRAQAASGGEETAWAPLLTHAHHTHKNVHVKVSTNVYMGVVRMCQQWCPGRFFSTGSGLGTRLDIDY